MLLVTDRADESLASALRSNLRVELLEDRSTPSAAGAYSVADQFATTSPPADQPARASATQPAGQVAATQATAPAAATPDAPNPNSAVQAAQNFLVHIQTTTPNDTNFSSQWALNNTGQTGGTADADIDAPEAWDTATGSPKVSVGIIDTGVDYTHPDLYKNIWINQGEIPSSIKAVLTDTDGDGLYTFWDLNNSVNQGSGKIQDWNGNGRIDGGDLLNNSSGWEDGVDNDGNGYKDDLIGWDFVNNDNDPLDDNGHGSHVAGIIGATGNNGAGVTGVNWKVSLAGLKFLDSSGSGYISNAQKALDYAAANGFDVTNNSWGGGGYSLSFETSLKNARDKGVIFVAAAGNGGSDGVGDNNDTTANYPSNYNVANVVAVASTTSTDALSSFSNYGAATVDLGTPGSSIYSTYKNGGYATLSGTSMATPFVTGALALLKSKYPNDTYSQLIDRVLNNTDSITALSGKTVTGGRLNLNKALTAGSADTAGPKVTAATPNGTGAVSSVRLTFGEAIDPATFTAADVTGFTGPGGATIAVTGVTAVAGSGNKQFDVAFAAQTAVGSYTFKVGPDVRDTAGNLMDQNGDGANGEAADAYTVNFTVAALLEGGFETPRVGGYKYNPTGSAWTFTGTSGIAGNGSGFTKSNPNAPEGTQVAFLQKGGSVSQTLSLGAGTYTLSFEAAQRAGYAAQTVRVEVDGAEVGTFQPASTAYASYSTASFTLAAGPHTVTFRGLNTSGDRTAFIDQVVIA